MKLSILISTIDAGIDLVENALQEKDERVNYVVCHQYTDEVYLKTPNWLKRDDVVLTRMAGKGVSRSRNRAIELATGDIALLADNDVQYRKEYLDLILDVYEKEPDLDVACFKIKTQEGQPEYKAYPDKSFEVKDFSIYYPSIIEMTFRLKLIQENGIRFDERFGLGSFFSFGGEEKIFIYDCWRKGMIVRFIPEYVVSHTYKDANYLRRKNLWEKIKTVIGLEFRIKGSSLLLNSIKNPGMMFKKLWNNQYVGWND